MTAEEHRRLDEACLFEMERTSWRYRRDVLKGCRHCGQPFWSRNLRVYCRDTCRAAHWFAVHVQRPRDLRIRAQNAVRLEQAELA